MVCSSLMKDSGFETQEERMLQFESRGRKKADIPVCKQSFREGFFLACSKVSLLFPSGLQLLG